MLIKSTRKIAYSSCKGTQAHRVVRVLCIYFDKVDEKSPGMRTATPAAAEPASHFTSDTSIGFGVGATPLAGA
jgi:hypothetical protein